MGCTRTALSRDRLRQNCDSILISLWTDMKAIFTIYMDFNLRKGEGGGGFTAKVSHWSCTR